ncbi:MAG TPA: CoA transferase [Candidatus Dormibacteraeota bacterium]|nr:CoA transferase [Candidatus Dormibacteraeota bacterium]
MTATTPLEGVRIFDLTHALAGPYCTLVLGDLGADVIKVEPPTGDLARRWGPPFLEGEATYFLSVNRNKRSVALDLKREAAREAARRLALACDVVVENYRPGTASSFGLGPERLRSLRPDLIYASISGFGQTHPDLAGYDHIAQGTSGIMSVTGPAGGDPTRVGVSIGDMAAGMFTAQAILAALLARGRTGEGQTIDVGLHDSLLALLGFHAQAYFATGQVPRPQGNQHHVLAPYGTFATADGHLNLAVGSDAQFASFCRALGAPELVEDERFRTNADRHLRRDELTAEIERRMGERPTAAWLAAMREHGVPAGPINDVAGAFADDVTVARGSRIKVDHPVGEIDQVVAPWRLDGQPAPIRRPPPLLGQHTEEVLVEVAGLTPDEIAALRS